jgi:hypothetical protein
MATLTRSTKPGSEWTINGLRAYNITVTPRADDITTFFGIPTLPQPSVNQVILNNEKYPSDGIADRDDRSFFFHLERVMELEEESANFTAHQLGLLGYEVGNRFVHQRKDIHFFVCGGQTHAQTDVSLVDRNKGILLVMQEDKSHLEGMDPEPQLIAEAIAAHQYNNKCLERIGLPTIQAKMIPGIIMAGSTPTFYKIPVTQDLVYAVETGQYPEKPTIVHKLIPPVADLNRLVHDGMRPLNNRDVILRCFEAFKRFV